jgi:serine/threonine protein phosphatase PrpC
MSAGEQEINEPALFSQKFELDMRKGDVLILTTDGVSDNVWPQEAAAVVSTIMRRGGPPKVAAAGLANFARFRWVSHSLFLRDCRLVSGEADGAHLGFHF